MLLPNQRAIVHWHHSNKEYYVGKKDIKEAINYLTMTDGCYTKITVDIKQKI